MARARSKVPSATPLAVSRRSVTDDDREFLYALFPDTLPPDNGLDMLPPPERETLLRMQFEARERRYRTTYALADFDLLLLDETPVGNLFVDRGSDEYVLIELAVLPDYRGRGIGAQVVSEVLAEAGRLALPVRAHVRKHNLAWGLWKRLGFEISGDDGVYFNIVARPM